jgi:hypothetical protein
MNKNTNNNNIDVSDLDASCLVGVIEQRIYCGSDLPRIELYKVGDSHVIRRCLAYITQDVVAGPIDDPQAYVEAIAAELAELAGTSGEPLLEKLRWGLLDLDAIQTDQDDPPYRVIIHRSFNGYDTYDYATDDEFDSYAEAQAWVDSEDSGDYHLGHNECSRPEYKIV